MQQENEVRLEDIQVILQRHGNNKCELISILEDIQEKYGYLPEKALRIVGRETGCSLVDIYGVATFYRFFSLHPKGRHLVCACLGTACHVRGAPRIVAELEQQLGIKAGQTTADNEFTLETVNCLGACALGPVVVIDGHYYSKVKKSKIKQLLEEARNGLRKADTGKDESMFPIETNCPHCERSFRDQTFTVDGLPSLKLYVSANGKKTWLRLSSLYGSHTIAAESQIPEGTIANFTCPHCNSEIKGRSDCFDCGAPLISLPVTGGGRMKICSRSGCKNHILDLV